MATLPLKKTATPTVPPVQKAPAQLQQPVEEKPEPTYEDVGAEDEKPDFELPYTVEELTDARKRLAGMKAEDLLQIEKLIDDLQAQIKFPEARCVVFTELISENGLIVHPTVRGSSMEEALTQLARGINFAKTLNLKPNFRHSFSPETKQAFGMNVTPPAGNTLPIGTGATGTTGQQGQQKSYADQPPEFPADKLTAEIKGTEVTWRVSSQKKYPVYPVVIYREAMAASGLNEAEMSANALSDPTARQFDLNGHTAHYERNEKGHPKKITLIE